MYSSSSGGHAFITLRNWRFVGERAECHRSPVVAAALIRAFAPQQNRHLGRLNISQALVPVDFLLHYPGSYMRK